MAADNVSPGGSEVVYGIFAYASLEYGLNFCYCRHGFWAWKLVVGQGRVYWRRADLPCYFPPSCFGHFPQWIPFVLET
jgi:hypothetical protein